MSNEVSAVRTAPLWVESRDFYPSIRWVAIGVFTLSNILNFMDRQALAALAPTILRDFRLSNAQYGTLISAFSLTYALAALVAGWFVDRVGLSVGTTAAVSTWSLGGICTGFVQSFRGLLFCRGVLGFGEAAGLPFLAKATATYLPPAEWGLANAVGSVAVTLGSVAAPLAAATLSPHFGWRSVFIVSGSLGFIWVAVWLYTARQVPPSPRIQSAPAVPIARVLADGRLWRVIAAYPLVMMVFIVWLNWTTLYLVRQYGLGEQEANRFFAWIPPIFATLGGFTNGFLTYRWIKGGMNTLSARVRVAIWMIPLLLLAGVTPLMPSAVAAVATIGIGLFAVQGVISSLNVIPIDLFGPGRAAFCISLLACAYALMQTFVAPIIGHLVDSYGFSAICVGTSALSLAGVWIVLGLRTENPVPAAESHVA